MDDVPAGIWQRIKFERERLGHRTVQSFAKVVKGMSWQRLAALERDTKRRNVQFYELAALGIAGCDVQFILTGVRLLPVLDDLEADERALLENYRAANEPGKQALRRVGVALAQPDLALGDVDADNNAFLETIRLREIGMRGRR